MEMNKINLEEKLNLFSEHWSPKIVADLNDQEIKVVKIKGEFVWHHHDDTDEMFFVIKGKLIMKLRDKDITLRPGEFIVIPKGIEHKPVCDEEVHLLLIEKNNTLNTGNVTDEKTAAVCERI